MEKSSTPIEGLFILKNPYHKDERGSFQKIFNKKMFENEGLNCNFYEFYYSINNFGVIRGMHFQLPPEDHTKVVYVSRGKIIDVVLDIRTESPTFGKYFSIELQEGDGRFIYIPSGCAHGFACLEEGSVVNYAQTTGYSSQADTGIRYDSFGFKWPFLNPILSERDKLFLSLKEFKSPF